MKPANLLAITSRYYFFAFAGLTFVFFAVFYSILRREVFHSIDEVLYNQKTRWVQQLRKDHGIVPPGVARYTNLVLRPAARLMHRDIYRDTIIYEQVDNEWDEFRKLSSTLAVDGKVYRLELVTPRLETHEIISSIVLSLVVVFALVVVAFYFFSRYLTRKLWRSFYRTLGALQSFQVGQTTDVQASDVRVEEFLLLDRSVRELMERTTAAFYQQKQFIENASHEMQTPLAIAHSKLELLISDPHLTLPQSEIVQTLLNSMQRLARLNKTLLLISKIENLQFVERERISLTTLISTSTGYFEDHRDKLHLEVTIDCAADAGLAAHPMMADLLVTNLVKNAFVHNRDHGWIRIEGDSNHIWVSNTSGDPAIPEDKLFKRFFRQSTKGDSWGLGLALVKRIVEINKWSIMYGFEDGCHSFRVDFAKE